MRVRLYLFSFLLVIFGCTVTGAGNTAGYDTVGISSGSLDEETDTGTEESTSEDSGPFLDLPDNTSFGDPLEDCEQMDFLFVIDNSGSMGDNQTNLINNFPVFMTSILNNIPSLVDYHIGVVTTDSYVGNEPGCNALGSLVTEIGSWSTPQTVCGPFVNGKRFMTQADDIVSKFQCIANVGSSGSGAEQQLAVIPTALEGWLNSPGQCNDGFFRPDVTLVIVILTDEDDWSGGGSAMEYFDHLVWLKGDVDDVVVLTLGPQEGSTCAPFYAEKLSEFTYAFQYGLMGNVCASDYSPFFATATSWVAAACAGEPIPVE